MSPASTDEPSEAVPRAGAWARSVSWSKSQTERAATWANTARETHPTVDVGFRLADRDKRVAAGVLAGGMAYRLFFWMLSFSLLANGALGFVDGHRAEQTLLDLGVPTVVAATVRDVAHQSEHARWWVIIVGGWLVLWTGYAGAKALVLVHAAVWDVEPTPIRHPFSASVGFSGSVLAFVATMGMVQWVRSESHDFALLVTLASAIVPLLFWLVVSARLPHRGSGWRDLLPGALVVAVGVHGMYLFTTWFLGPKLASATATYGLLGVVATVLFWLYIVGRLVIGGATLTASLYDHRARGTDTAGGSPAR